MERCQDTCWRNFKDCSEADSAAIGRSVEVAIGALQESVRIGSGGALVEARAEARKRFLGAVRRDFVDGARASSRGGDSPPAQAAP
jgi:hypothetical protein